jgi:hypothetical protein
VSPPSAGPVDRFRGSKRRDRERQYQEWEEREAEEALQRSGHSVPPKKVRERHPNAALLKGYVRDYEGNDPFVLSVQSQFRRQAQWDVDWVPSYRQCVALELHLGGVDLTVGRPPVGFVTVLCGACDAPFERPDGTKAKRCSTCVESGQPLRQLVA